MRPFHLQIVTPSGTCYDGNVHEVTVPSIDGAVSILAGHIPYVTALGKGPCTVYALEGVLRGTCTGGMLTVTKEGVRVVTSVLVWDDKSGNTSR